MERRIQKTNGKRRENMGVLHVVRSLDALKKRKEKRKENKSKEKVLHVLGSFDALGREVRSHPDGYTSVVVRHPYCQHSQ